jgi:hypothetical protein
MCLRCGLRQYANFCRTNGLVEIPISPESLTKQFGVQEDSTTVHYVQRQAVEKKASTRPCAKVLDAVDEIGPKLSAPAYA